MSLISFAPGFVLIVLPTRQRRAERIDSTRSLDILADLSLGHSDDDADDDRDPNGGPEITPEGIGHFVAMLPPPTGPPAVEASSSTPAHDGRSSQPQRQAPNPRNQTGPLKPEVPAVSQAKPRSKGGKRKGKGRSGVRDNAPRSQSGNGATRNGSKPSTKPSKWADRCMYAELLEMNESLGSLVDGIPDDIETAFVSVAPVPIGKRCLAVTHQTSGIAGVGESYLHSYMSSPFVV